MTVTVLYPALAVHAAGCSDIHKTLQKGWDSRTKTNVDGTEDYESIEDAVADLNEGGDWDREWQVSDFAQYPCLKTGPKAAKPVAPGRCAGSGQPFQFERSTDRMRLYYPCPVCGKYMGTGRGTVPAHKAK